MSAGDVVNLVEGVIPDDYHCRCEFCQRTIGELRPPGGGHYSRLERRAYYDPVERGKDNDNAHIAKTPLHIARWAVQRYTAPGDWVLDPTIGAGTTAVEAITQGRHAAGMELQFSVALEANLKRARDLAKSLDDTKLPPYAKVRIGDARRLGAFLNEIAVPEFALVVNNPPYSGDEHAGAGGETKSGGKTWTTTYKDGLPNLAFLDEGPAYFDAITSIYAECAARLRPGGYFIFGIKDMMRSRKPFMLHQKFNALLTERVGLVHIGTAFLKHHPTTLFLNTYFKRYGVHPPYYQTISVFRKD